jgi:hypothetical protein
MGAGGAVLRFAAGLVSGIACVVLFVGGSGIADRAAQNTRRKLGAWDSRLLAGLQRAGRIESSPKLVRKLLQHDGSATIAHGRALTVAGTCSADLRTDVGRPPTERLRSALAAFERACTHLQRFHNAITLALLRGEGYLVRQAQAEANRGGKLLLEADSGLPPGEVRPLPVIGGDSTESRIEPRFGKVASWLAGKDVEVRCWSRGDWIRLLREEKAYTKHHIDEETLGFAGIDGNRVNLAPDVCAGLVDLAYRHADPSPDEAWFPFAAAVVTLAHEPQHSKGVAVEAQAECYAIQLAAATARRLGVGLEAAARLARLYWEHYGEELPAYRSPQCRNGGMYDLDKTSSSWP